MIPALGAAPPQQVVEACCRGLAARLRSGEGGTEAAVEFARLVYEGFPIDGTIAAEVVEAHRQLDRAVLQRGGTTRSLDTSRDLWGGDSAPGWAAGVIERRVSALPQPPPGLGAWPAPGHHQPPPAPNPAPVLAAHQPGHTTTPEWLTELDSRLDRLEQAALAGLVELTRLAYLGALRHLGVVARRSVKRVPQAVRAGLNDSDVDRLMSTVKQMRVTVHDQPERRQWEHTAPVLAVLGVTLEEALVGAFDDLEDAAARLISETQEAVVTETADALGVDPGPLLDDSADERAAAQAAAVAALVAGVSETIASRVTPSDRPSTTEPADDAEMAGRIVEHAETLQVPTWVAGTAAALAGGAAGSESSVSRDAATGIPVDDTGRSVTGLAARWVRDTFARVGRSVRSAAETGRQIVGAAADLVSAAGSVQIVDRYTWVYGDAATRVTPFPPHRALAGTTWDATTTATPEVTAADPETGEIVGFYPQDHPGCQCRLAVRRTLAVVPADEGALASV